MKNNKFKLSRALSSLALASVMLLSNIVPAMAEQNVASFSMWAMAELNEAEKYGLYSMDWYEDDLSQTISKEKLDSLVEATDRKIAELDLPKNDNFKKLDYKQDQSREEVLTRLYNILATYELVGKADIKGDNAIKYFEENHIIKGSSNGLGLNKKASAEQSIIFAKRLVMHINELFEKGSKGFLWEVQNKGNTMYLLGSIHIGDNSIYPFNKELRDKFTGSDYLLLENNMLEDGGMEDFLKISKYTDGTSLKDHISDETYKKTIKVLEENKLPVEEYKMLKPWRIANDLSQIASTDNKNMEEASLKAMLGIDIYFETTAMIMGKPIIELEGLKYQANLFDSLSKETQEEYLNGMLDVLLDGEEKTEEDTDNIWLKQWKDGDVEGFKESYIKSLQAIPNKEMTEMLVGKRDEDMANKLVQLLESDDEKTYFVVVGSAHFVVDDNIIDHLRSKGYTINSLNE